MRLKSLVQLRITRCVRAFRPSSVPRPVCQRTHFRNLFPKRRLLYSFPAAKTRRRGNFRSAPDLRNLQHQTAAYTQNAADAIRIQPRNLWTFISNFLLRLIISSDIRPTAAAFNFILKFCLCRQIRHQFSGEQSFTFRHD